MKKYIILVLILSFQFLFSQEDIVLKKASDNILKILSDKNTDNIPQIYIADIEIIDSLVKLSKKKYKIIYNFSDRCHASVEVFPKLIEFINTNSDEFELFPIIGHRYSRIAGISEYLKKQSYFKPIYILDTKKYGNRRNPFKRLEKLIKMLCKECNYKKMGFSDYFVINNLNQVILKTNYDLSEEESLNKLTELKI